MIDTYLRKIYQKNLLDPIAKRFTRLPPNLVTALACLFGCAILFLARSHPILAVVCLILSGFLDTLDGTLARLRGSTSTGTILDILSDRIVETAIVIGLFTPERGLACLLMLGSILLCITSFLVVGIFSQNESEKGFHYSPGLMERTEAFLFFGAMILMPTRFMWLAYTFAALVFYTATQRVISYCGRQRRHRQSPRATR